jgi:hypothetical protein
MGSRRIYLRVLLLSVFVMALSSLSLAQYPPPPPPGPVWGHGARPHRGACFFKDVDFGGEYFCVRAGQSYGYLPPGFNDKISSIQVYRSAVSFFADRDFGGASGQTRRSLSNLKAWPLPTDPRRTWNDRISSIQVN